MTVRKFTHRYSLEDLVTVGTLSRDLAAQLRRAVDDRKNILISGGTGTGKTTLLNALAATIPDADRIVLIEETSEILIEKPNLVRFEARRAQIPLGQETPLAAVTISDLVRATLRHRPDRILVGEVRGSEAFDLLQALNTGHLGSLTTIHANDARDALARLELMVAMAGFELPIPVVRQYIASGLSLVVHLARLKSGIRRVMRVSEIVGLRDGGLQLEDIFGFEQTGVDDTGVAQGEFYITGYRPLCLSRLRAAGIRLPDEMFDKRRFPVRS